MMASVFIVHLGVDFDPSPYVHGVCTYYYGTYDIDNVGPLHLPCHPGEWVACRLVRDSERTNAPPCALQAFVI